jgi:hypothetical protein
MKGEPNQHYIQWPLAPRQEQTTSSMTRLCYLVAGFFILVCNSLAYETIHQPVDGLDFGDKRTLRAHTKIGKKSDSNQSDKSKGKGEKKKKLYEEPEFSLGSLSKSRSKSKSTDSESKSVKGAEKGTPTELKGKKGSKKREKQPKNVTFHPTTSPNVPEEEEEPLPAPDPSAPEPSTSRPLLTDIPSTVSIRTQEPTSAVQSPSSQTPATPSAVDTTKPPSQTPSQIQTTLPRPGVSELPSAAPSQIGPGQASLRPAPASEEPERQCSIDIDACCASSDCASTETCANRNCIQGGCPQFTLTWTGDANLDLFVMTPAGVSLWAAEPSDLESGGVWEEGDGSGIGDYNVENVYFPIDCSSSTGIYEYFVVSGDTVVEWDLTVSVNGAIQETQFGLGASATFQYLHVATPGTLDPGGSGGCQVSENECCEATDCPSGSSCAERNCVLEGALRFTLTWVGSGIFEFVA